MKDSKPESVLSLHDLCKNFAGVTAVKDVNLEIAPGARHVLIGTNGAGKTTLFNIIAGDLPATSGRIMLFGQNVTKLPVYKRVKFGMRRTYQSSALFDQLTVAQNFYLALLGKESLLRQSNFVINYKRNKAYANLIEDEASEVNLENVLDKVVTNLSHGEKRQLEIGLALITKPKFLMLDEPSSGLSENERQSILAILKAIDKSVTILLIEHNMELAFNLADTITVMYNGEIVAEGNPQEIQSSELVHRIYLGEA